jgi:probable rRNA maturation factor
VVVNGQRAADVAGQFGWKPADELLLYIVHGVLHLCGYDDHSESASRRMRIREKEVLARWGAKEKGKRRK